MDKIQELEERLNRLENRLKANFLEIEKRFAEISEGTKLPEDIGERFNELEDLLLLLQVENTKIKEKLSGNLSFGGEVDTASINDRINKLDERVSEISTAAEPSLPGDLMEKVNKIEEYNTIINEIKARLESIEYAKHVKHITPVRKRTEEKPVILPSRGLLSEINKILESE